MLRTNIVFDEGIFTPVSGTSIRSGKSKIPLALIAVDVIVCLNCSMFYFHLESASTRKVEKKLLVRY